MVRFAANNGVFPWRADVVGVPFFFSENEYGTLFVPALHSVRWVSLSARDLTFGRRANVLLKADFRTRNTTTLETMFFCTAPTTSFPRKSLCKCHLQKSCESMQLMAGTFFAQSSSRLALNTKSRDVASTFAATGYESSFAECLSLYPTIYHASSPLWDK